MTSATDPSSCSRLTAGTTNPISSLLTEAMMIKCSVRTYRFYLHLMRVVEKIGLSFEFQRKKKGGLKFFLLANSPERNSIQNPIESF